ncbi:hypothetical protein MmiHf6_01020 [Methanimicrococcus hongohii]|uniref:DUF488 family protein n=1 Tax=Methanimicrococcus hongohii TaxID=3028295 RepID=A0AA96V983_9EURY|nr:DUF488 family protein [Methanimicrococcus sp. Hf6]WNY22817.1 hypothetical protein MmiHf6_01020 [Methanimicrococcus sp. Hf6]
MKNRLRLKRAYDAVSKDDGFRILVDRLWPRGVSKEHAAFDLWAKEVTPSTEIREEFHHIPTAFPKFKEKYLSELGNNPAVPEFIQTVYEHLKKGNVTFVYAAKDPVYNHVVILKEYVESYFPKD